jgi:DNA-binding transcriptional LysR family regulator
MNLEFRHLEIFCEVVRMKSFSRASKKVGLSQASVSERITALEEQVGARLLDRSHRRGVWATPVGRALYERAIHMLQDREHTVQELREMLGMRQGTLRVAASTVPGTYFLPSIIQQFSALHPNTRFSLAISGGENVIDCISTGQHEIGIVGDGGGSTMRGNRAALRSGHRLWRDKLVLAVPARHPLTKLERVSLADLVQHPYIMREPGSSTRRWLELYLHERLPNGASSLSVAAEVSTLCAMKQAVIHGIGVSIMSACAITAEVKAGLVETVPLVDQGHFSRTFHLIQDDRRTLSPLCSLFVEFLLQHAELSESDASAA